jgi:N-acyl amino acid synthase of PEP-CTERM/exosortase system
MGSLPRVQPSPPIERDAPAVRLHAPLIDTYNALFQAVQATTLEELREAYRLRYQVYCIENQFENPADHPGGFETDPYDARSLHALLFHRPTGLVAGTVRLVLPRRGNPLGSLPIHAVCSDPRLADANFLPPERSAEFSRFAISKEFRRRVGDQLYGGVSPSVGVPDHRRIIPHITLGLMAVALRMIQGTDIDHVCAIMEPSLLRLLARLGIHFTAIGPMVDYHGLRQPCGVPVDELFAVMQRERPDVWEVITDRGRYLTASRRSAPSRISAA